MAVRLNSRHQPCSPFPTPTPIAGAGLVFTNAAVITDGRMANALLQEFLFKRFTSHPAQ